ncbi:MAG: preprotein translocase subunit SecG [Oscillospiraceae bacterium]
MSIVEVISGGILLVVSVLIILIVVSQEPSNSQGVGVVDGGQSSYYGQGRTRTSNGILKTITVIGAVLFFITTIAVNLVSVF